MITLSDNFDKPDKNQSALSPPDPRPNHAGVHQQRWPGRCEKAAWLWSRIIPPADRAMAEHEAAMVETKGKVQRQLINVMGQAPLQGRRNAAGGAAHGGHEPEPAKDGVVRQGSRRGPSPVHKILSSATSSSSSATRPPTRTT